MIKEMIKGVAAKGSGMGSALAGQCITGSIVCQN